MNTNALLAASVLYRKDFFGKNDKYAPIANRDSTLQLALSGYDILDVSGTLSQHLRDQSLQRQNRYRLNTNFYEGRHFVNPYDSTGAEKLVFNYCSQIVDVSADWLVAKGFSFSCPEGNEPVADLLNSVWEYNHGSALLWKAAQFGGICGDSFIYVTVETKDASGNDLPQDKWAVKLSVLNPAWVHPIWSPNNPDVMASCLIQFPFMDVAGHVTLLSVLITPEKIVTWKNNEQTSTIDNPFGMVNVVHIPHQIVANGSFGTGEIDQIWRINQKLDTVGSTIDRIIQYHAEPTTIVYGVAVSQLEKGSNKLWSNLPIGAKVENLQLQGDLKATVDWYSQLKKEIAVKGEVPMFLLDSETFKHVSNTSGAAMQLMFQPLLSKTDRRRVTYKRGMLEVSRLILAAHEHIIGDDLSLLADNKDSIYTIDMDFTSPLPRDDKEELDTVIKKLNAGIVSQAEAIRQVSNVKNVQRLILELAADRRAKLADARESFIASSGGEVSYSSVFLSSPFLSEDMEEIATKLVSTAPQADEGIDETNAS